MFRAPDDQALL